MAIIRTESRIKSGLKAARVTAKRAVRVCK
nr:MAG TPA_asm: hypothetical protein [Caudoviricetes sp.]